MGKTREWMDRGRISASRRAAAGILVVLGAACTSAADQPPVPTFEVDPFWPEPLEYPHILGPVSGVTVAPDGNVLIVTRQDGFNAGNEINSVNGTGTCCTPTRAVLDYAPDGSLMREWGAPDEGYPWPQRPHGIAVDPDGNVWIGGGVAPGGSGGEPRYDTHILKFSREGEHLLTVGEVGQEPDSRSATSFGGPAGLSFDADAAEVYVADGYANRRVAVLDLATGELKRSWGAYGEEPDDAPLDPYDPDAPAARQFRAVTCAELSGDGLVYVCDRGNNRIQVFETDGTFVTEAVIAPRTLGEGSVWDVAFSPDAEQRFLYVADGMNERVYIVERSSLEVRTSFGTGGRVAGHFRELGGVAVDAEGNVYTAENGQGRRVQKFLNTGTGPITAEHQGAVWPAGDR